MEILSFLTSIEVGVAFFTLTALELVLGIDNIIFISILVGRLPPQTREKARRIGLFFAMFMRIGLLVLLSLIVGATTPVFTLLGKGISPRDIVLICGGLFLIWKSTQEIHQLLEGESESPQNAIRTAFAAIVFQIIVIDLVFSLDSIITAVGMVRNVSVMIAAVVASVALMMLFAKAISDFITEHPTIKMLALSFLLVVGVALVAEGFGHYVLKGYIYFAMAFSLGVEMLNIRMRKKHVEPVHFHEPLNGEVSD